MTSWCTLTGHQDHWETVGNYRVRVCQRKHCRRITAVITWQQWPTPPIPEVGWTTTTEPPW